MQLEGAISKDFFKVRDLLYKQYAIVWWGTKSLAIADHSSSGWPRDLAYRDVHSLIWLLRTWILSNVYSFKETCKDSQIIAELHHVGFKIIIF